VLHSTRGRLYGLDSFNTFNTLNELKPKKNWRQKGKVERGKKDAGIEERRLESVSSRRTDYLAVDKEDLGREIMSQLRRA